MANVELPHFLASKPETDFIVLTTRYPTSYGYNNGRVWTEIELIRDSTREPSRTTYATYEAAAVAAKEVRSSECNFDYI